LTESDVYIYNSTFKKGMAKEGGAIYMLGFSYLLIYNSVFTEC